MKKKNVFAFWFSITLALFLILSACSNAAAPADESGGDTDPPASETPQAQEEPAAGENTEDKEPVTLRLLTWFVGHYQKEFDLFHEKYPWITIEPLVVGGDAAMMEQQAALQAAGDSADLTWIQDLSNWTKDGLLEDLTPYIENDETIQNADIAEGHLEAFQTGDKTYAIPFSKISEWILVNKDLLEKKGLEMPPNDWTYDDFLEMAIAATDPAAGEYGIAYDNLFNQHFKWAYSVANGSSDNLYFLNEDLTQSLAHTPAVLEDLRWIQELTFKHHVIPTPEEAEAMGWDGNNSFLTGKALFTLGADWVLPGLVEQAAFEWDVLPMPVGKKMQATTQILGPIGILAASKHKEEAWLWLSFQFELEAQKFMIENGANTFVNHPELEAYVEEVDLWKGKNTEAIKMSMKMCCNLPGANIPVFYENLTTIDNPITDMLRKNVDLSTIKPAVEAWNKKTLEAREELGL